MLSALISAETLASSPTIDGHYDASEGYTNGFEVLFWTPNGAAIYAGEFWLHQDRSGNVSAALILPLSIKDNTYGDNSSPGYDQVFTDLTNSDRANFVFKEDDGGFATSGLGSDGLNLDFFKDISASGPDYVSGFTGEDGSPSTTPISGALAATSMQYNFDNTSNAERAAHFGQGKSSPSTGDTSLSFWDFTHAYEFFVPASGFGTDGIDTTSQAAVSSQILLAEIHLSPHMQNFSFATFGAALPSTFENPEPGSAALAMIGFVTVCGFGLSRRKKRHVLTAHHKVTAN